MKEINKIAKELRKKHPEWSWRKCVSEAAKIYNQRKGKKKGRKRKRKR